MQPLVWPGVEMHLLMVGWAGAVSAAARHAGRRLHDYFRRLHLPYVTYRIWVVRGLQEAVAACRVQQAVTGGGRQQADCWCA